MSQNVIRYYNGMEREEWERELGRERNMCVKATNEEQGKGMKRFMSTNEMTEEEIEDMVRERDKWHEKWVDRMGGRGN